MVAFFRYAFEIKTSLQSSNGIVVKTYFCRMRGLLGDATEEFIESLDKKEGEASNDEEIYKRAKVIDL